MSKTQQLTQPIALNNTSPIVLGDGWQSVAVLPQMLKWKHDLDYITDANQKDYWSEKFLKKKLDELENNELEETTLNSGFLYVYCNGYLVTEYEVRAEKTLTSLSSLHRVDLDNYAGCDERPALDEKTFLIELLYGGMTEKRYEIAYSEYQWPWLLINYYGGASENEDFDNFKNIFQIDKCQPGLIPAPDDKRLLDGSPEAAAKRRAKRFTVISLEENTNYIAFDQKLDKTYQSISQALPSEWAISYPALGDQPDFEYPCYWLIHYTIQHAHTLALELVEMFNIAHTGLTSLVQAMGDPDDRKMFPKSEHIESAILASQLYYKKPNPGNFKTAWLRDCNKLNITNKLAYGEIQEILKSQERAVYRNILLVITERLGVLVSSSHQSKYAWKTIYDETIDTDFLSEQLVAYLNDFKAAPLKPDLQEEDLSKGDLIIATAHDRWAAPGTLLSPFSVDPLELCLLFEGERQYHDAYIKNIEKFQGIGASVQNDIINGKHGISTLCLPGFIDKNIEFSFEKVLADLFNSNKTVKEKQDSAQAKDLYQQWLDVGTYNQNKKAKKPKDLPYADQITQDGFAYGTLVFKAISTFVTKFPKVIESISSGNPQIASLHIGYMRKLMGTLGPIGFKEGSFADLFKHSAITGGKRVERATRIELIADFLEARQESDPDFRRKKKIKQIRHQQSHKNFGKATRKNYEIILSDTFEDYKRFLKDPSMKKAVILNPEDSKVWETNLKTNILLVDTPEGESYDQAIAKHLKDAHLATTVGGFLMIADFYNLYTSINKFRTNTNKSEDSKLVFGLISQIAGTGNSVFGVVENINKIQTVAKSSSNWAKVSRYLVGKDTGWKLSRYAFASKYLPFVGGVIGLSLSASDLASSYNKDDDVYIVHLIGTVGAALSIVGIFYAGAILGPVGLGLAVLGLLLSKYVFKQDNLLEEWLDHGVFSRANTEFMSVNKYMRFWEPGNMVSQTGIPSQLMEKDDRIFFANESGERPMDLISIVIPDDLTHIVLDQNYVLLGVDQQGYKAVGSKMMVEIHNNYIHFGGTPIAPIGKTFANSADELRQKVTQLYKQNGGKDEVIDKENRGKGGDWLGDDDKKFAKPFAKFPEANVEALLNASYPFNIKCHMYPAKGSVNRRSREDNASGNNIAVVIDIPYFVEGQSKLFIELRETRGFRNERKEMQVIPFTENGEYKIEVDTILQLENYDIKKHRRLSGPSRGYQLYKSEKNGIPQLVLIANIFPKRDIHKFKDRWNNYSVYAEAWARLSINGTDEDEKVKDIDGEKLKSVWMPYRSPQGWEDYEKGYTILQEIIKGSGREETLYVSPDSDWVSANSADKARN